MRTTSHLAQQEAGLPSFFALNEKSRTQALENMKMIRTAPDGQQ